MANVTSDLATAQALALVKGPARGQEAAVSHLRIMEDSVSLPVGDITTAQRIRFGSLPQGAKLIASLCSIISTHTADIAGAITLTPVDGSTSTQSIASVTIARESRFVAASGNSETLTIPVGSINEAAASVVLAKECFVDFVPASDTTIASSTKTAYARLVYATVN